jgi:N-acetylglucosamine-6-sulfatase
VSESKKHRQFVKDQWWWKRNMKYGKIQTLNIFTLRNASSVLMPFVLVLLATLAATGDASALAQKQAPEKPNIVLILADDMRADDFEHMPQSHQLLAEQGLTFSNAFVTYSLCCPSRASILRGQYAHNHQILEDDAQDSAFKKFRNLGHERSTIATWLKDSGYKTVLFGKYLNGYDESGDVTYIPPGWDDWYAQISGYYYNYKINENGRLVSYGYAEKDYYTDVLARQAKDYVRHAAADSSPFFIYLAPKTPHSPYTVAPRHKKSYKKGVKAPRPPSFKEADVSDKPLWVQRLSSLTPGDNKGKITNEKKLDQAYRDRLGMLLSLDEMVGGLVEELKVTGELENTYIIFTSDNGFHLGEHWLNLTKRTPYEEAHRVPLVIRGPGVPSGRTVDEIGLNIDFAPTFAELAGASAPSFVDGRSLSPLLVGTQPTSWRSAFLLENWRDQTERKPGNPVLATLTYDGIRTETHKYVEYDTGEKELYDLSSDPYELQSQHKTANPELEASLKTKLNELKSCSGQSCRNVEDAP